VTDDVARRGLDKVEQQAKKGGLARTVVSYQAETLAFGDFQTLKVQNGLCAVIFGEVPCCYHTSRSFDRFSDKVVLSAVEILSIKFDGNLPCVQMGFLDLLNSRVHRLNLTSQSIMVLVSSFLAFFQLFFSLNPAIMLYFLFR